MSLENPLSMMAALAAEFIEVADDPCLVAPGYVSGVEHQK